MSIVANGSVGAIRNTASDWVTIINSNRISIVAEGIVRAVDTSLECAARVFRTTDSVLTEVIVCEVLAHAADDIARVRCACEAVVAEGIGRNEEAGGVSAVGIVFAGVDGAFAIIITNEASRGLVNTSTTRAGVYGATLSIVAGGVVVNVSTPCAFVAGV